MAIYFVDFPIKNGGSFHSQMLVHQRVILMINQLTILYQFYSQIFHLHLVEGAQSQRADSLGIAVFGDMEVSEVIGLSLFIHFRLGFSMEINHQF